MSLNQGEEIKASAVVGPTPRSPWLKQAVTVRTSRKLFSRFHFPPLCQPMLWAAVFLFWGSIPCGTLALGTAKGYPFQSWNPDMTAPITLTGYDGYLRHSHIILLVVPMSIPLALGKEIGFTFKNSETRYYEVTGLAMCARFVQINDMQLVQALIICVLGADWVSHPTDHVHVWALPANANVAPNRPIVNRCVLYMITTTIDTYPFIPFPNSLLLVRREC